MENKRLAICGILGGMAMGVASLASPSVRAFTEGILGYPSPPETRSLNPELAAPNLSAPLQAAEMDELLQGIADHAAARFDAALPIIGKYAMRGDVLAQKILGGMYAFGQGVPVDREEALRWLTLAANQGDGGATELAARIKATPDWERRAAALAVATSSNPDGSRPEADPTQANRGSLPPIDYGPGLSVQPPSYNGSNSGAGSPYGRGTLVSPSAPMGARASVEQAYGSGSASRGHSSALTGIPPGGDSSPVILSRAGPGTYSAGNGDIYTQAGPNGVINTRTGEFSPTN
jgi:Sel1 repeat